MRFPQRHDANFVDLVPDSEPGFTEFGAALHRDLTTNLDRSAEANVLTGLEIKET
jgi:hypothetical protein